MTNLIGIYGASGCGRGLLPIAREQYSDSKIVFIDDGYTADVVNGHSVLNWQEFLELKAEGKSVAIAIAASNVRQTLARKCERAKVPLIEVRAVSAVQMDEVIIGEGACISPFVTFTSNIRIGRCFHANLYSYVEHDCVIGDFVTLAPGAKVNGNVYIGSHVYVGSGALVRQGCSIGDNAIIGMGAVVTKDIPPGFTVVGNPAKPLIKN